MDNLISSADLTNLLAAARPADRPLLIDVRRDAAYIQAPDLIAGALRRDPQSVATWAAELPAAQRIVVYCVHGHEVSQNAAQALRASGRNAQFLDHGLEGWRAHGGHLARKPNGAHSRWVTREHPKIDRVACPWLITRFIDKSAEFLYVPAAEVRAVAAARTAIPYDIADVEFGHAGELSSFDAFIDRFRLGADPALARLATIVRGADTGQLDLAPQCAGLLAASLGLARLFADDHEMLKHAMVLYDALYQWCRDGHDSTLMWNPDTRHAT